MPIRAQCPAGHAMMVPDHRAGTRLRCPRCGTELLVPGTAAPVPAAPPTASEPAAPQPSPKPRIKKPAASGSLASKHFVPAKGSAILKHPPRPPVVHTAPPPAKPVTIEPAAAVAPVPPPVAPPAPLAVPAVLPEPPPVPTPPPVIAAPTIASVEPPSVEPAVAPPALVIPSPPPAITRVRKPWIPESEKGEAVFHLALVLGGLAAFSTIPAVWEWFVLWQDPEFPPVPPWVFAILFTAVLQFGYAVYLAYVPDWSALSATTIAMLAAAAAWATLLGTTLVGKDESFLVMLFRYADKLEGNRAAMWCFIMLCFTSVAAYFLGLTAARWYRSYQLLKGLRAGDC